MFEELQSDLTQAKQTLYEIRQFLAIEDKDRRADELKTIMSAPGFWNHQEEAQVIIQELKMLKALTDPWKECFAEFEDVDTLLQLAEDEQEKNLIPEIRDRIQILKRKLDRVELGAFLSGDNDPSHAYVMIHSGAGGTEACDWTDMLFRMYSRWAERRGFDCKVIDLQQGEEAGIKSVTALISGPYAYGYLKSEKGVHRLVRISPFDANKRRHTSFSSVDVSPEISDDIEIEIAERDLRVDTYRASGAGGQHVNKTDSAVRITHLPTSIVVQCQSDRSQHKNRASAMKILRSRLYELEMRKKEEAVAKEHGEKKKIEWGSQIRSYVFHPYTLVKDLRSGCETSDGTRVMDGDIDLFIEAFLKMRL